MTFTAWLGVLATGSLLGVLLVVGLGAVGLR